MGSKSTSIHKNKSFLDMMAKFSKDYMSLVAILLIGIVFSFASPYFFSSSNFCQYFAAVFHRGYRGHRPGSFDGHRPGGFVLRL